MSPVQYNILCWCVVLVVTTLSVTFSVVLGLGVATLVRTAVGKRRVKTRELH